MLDFIDEVMEVMQDSDAARERERERSRRVERVKKKRGKNTHIQLSDLLRTV